MRCELYIYIYIYSSGPTEAPPQQGACSSTSGRGRGRERGRSGRGSAAGLLEGADAVEVPASTSGGQPSSRSRGRGGGRVSSGSGSASVLLERADTVELPEESAAIVEDISSSILGSGPLPAESAEVAKTVLLPERMLPRVETARQDPRFADITVGFILGGPDKRRSLSVLRGDMLYIPGGQSTDAPHTCGRLDALLEENHRRIVGWIRAAPATSSRVLSQRDRSLQLSLQTREPLAFLAALFGPEVQFLRLDTRLGLSPNSEFVEAREVGYTSRGKRGQWRLVVDADVWDPTDIEGRLTKRLAATAACVEDDPRDALGALTAEKPATPITWQSALVDDEVAILVHMASVLHRGPCTDSDMHTWQQAHLSSVFVRGCLRYLSHNSDTRTKRHLQWTSRRFDRDF